MECTTQDTVEQSIFSKVHEKQYTLAREAPICNSTLFKTLGTLQAHLHPEQSLMTLTWHQKTGIWPQKSYLPKLQPFVS
jgi:hypothetical protein